MGLPPHIPLLFDADALIQILLVRQHQCFRQLSDDFGLVSYLMNEVDIEVKSNKRLGALIKPALDKSLKGKTLRLLSFSDLESFQSESKPKVTLADIRDLAADYELHVQRGEAATHAAGVLLNCPVVSNDLQALRTLKNNHLRMPPHVLRPFDIFLFLHSEGYISLQDLERIRNELRSQLEHLPQCFKSCSVETGMPNFQRRLLSSSLTAGTVTEPWASPLIIARISGRESIGLDIAASADDPEVQRRDPNQVPS